MTASPKTAGVTWPRAPEGSAAASLFAALRQAGSEYGGSIRAGRGGTFTCPLHGDTHPSLDIAIGKKGGLIYNCKPCEASGDFDGPDGRYDSSKFLTALLAALPSQAGQGRRVEASEVEWGEPYAGPNDHRPRGERPAGVWRPTARYSYTNAEGEEVFAIERREQFAPDGQRLDKTFRCTRRGLTPAQRVPYRWRPDEWQGQVVAVVEGEKDADTLAARGLLATTFAFGDCPTADMLAGWFCGPVGVSGVVVYGDFDAAGLAKAKEREAKFNEAGIEVLNTWFPDPLVLDLRGVPWRKADVSDVLAAGLGLDSMVDLETAEGLLTAWTAMEEWAGQAEARGITPGEVFSERVRAFTEAEWASAHTEPARAVSGQPEASEEPSLAMPSDTADAGEDEGETWQRVDLTDLVAGVFDGSLQPETPDLGRVQGGSPLLYSAQVNGLAGEPGSGKTWVALLVAAQVLAGGGQVVFIDYEDSARGAVERLYGLGVRLRAFRRFHYFNPASALPVDGLAAYVERVKPALVVVDSTGEASSLYDVKSNADDDVAAWFVKFPRRIAALGPAVLMLDHLPKDRENQRGPIGSQRKLAAVSGVQYIAEVKHPFSRDRFGSVILTVAKDRRGAYAKGERVAELVGGGGGAFALVAPEPIPVNADGSKRYTAVMEKVSLAAEETDGLSGRALTEAVGGRATIVRAAIKTLVAEGYLSETPHKSLKPYRQADDPSASQVAEE